MSRARFLTEQVDPPFQRDPAYYVWLACLTSTICGCLSCVALPFTHPPILLIKFSLPVTWIFITTRITPAGTNAPTGFAVAGASRLYEGQELRLSYAGKQLNVEQGDQAVLISASVNLVRKVSLFYQEVITEELIKSKRPHNMLIPKIFTRQKDALESINKALPGNGWVELAEDVASIDYQVALTLKKHTP